MPPPPAWKKTFEQRFEDTIQDARSQGWDTASATHIKPILSKLCQLILSRQEYLDYTLINNDDGTFTLTTRHQLKGYNDYLSLVYDEDDGQVDILFDRYHDRQQVLHLCGDLDTIRNGICNA